MKSRINGYVSNLFFYNSDYRILRNKNKYNQFKECNHHYCHHL